MGAMRWAVSDNAQHIAIIKDIQDIAACIHPAEKSILPFYPAHIYDHGLYEETNTRISTVEESLCCP
jgi:hypothetical protein